MATFTGTTQKCKACDKTVHFIDMISTDGVCYHNTCFRCCECNGKLSMSHYIQLDGNLYCKPHFQQLFKRTGSFSMRSLSGRLLNSDQPKTPRTPSKAASAFTGTKDKCAVCEKVVYPLDKVSVEGEFFHKSCFRCAHGGCNITTSSYAALDGILYCKPHFSQLFKEKGCYNHLTKMTSLKRAEAAALLREVENIAKETEDFVNAPVSTTKEPDNINVTESEPDELVEQANEEEIEPQSIKDVDRTPKDTPNPDHTPTDSPKENDKV